MYLTRCPQSLLLAFFFFLSLWLFLCRQRVLLLLSPFLSLPPHYFSHSAGQSPYPQRLPSWTPKTIKKCWAVRLQTDLLDWLYLDLQYMLLAWNHLVPRFLNPQHSCDWLTKYPFSLTKKNPSAHSPATQPHSTGIFLGIELEVTMRHRQT